MNRFSHSAVPLYCFAYAGGSAQVFKPWSRLGGDDIDVRAIELPGRGLRYGEPPQAHYRALVTALAAQVAADITAHQSHHHEMQYAMFGHSAGATFAFAVASRVATTVRCPPLHCFLAAGTPPHVAKKERATMNDADLVKELRLFSATPDHVLDQPELLNCFLPMLRADFQAYEQSSHDHARRIDCPFTLFAADRDDVAPEQVWEWGRYSTRAARQVLLQGDHFSILKSPQPILAEIGKTLAAERALRADLELEFAQY